MRKVVIYTPNDNTGGTERVSTIYAHALHNEGYIVRVCSIFKPLKKYDVEKYRGIHFSLFLSRRPRLIRPLLLYFSFLGYIIKGYELVIQGEYPAAISYFLPKRVIIRVTNLTDELRKEQPKLYRLFMKAIAKNIAIFPTKYIKNKFPVDLINYHILPNPFDLTVTKRARKKEKNKEEVNFISVGQLNYQKDHEFMVKAFAKFVKEGEHSCKLYIYGKGILEKDIRKLIKSLGMTDNIKLEGWTNNPWCERDFDYHLLTSRWEGYPNVIIEAAHHEIATVATPIEPGIGSIVEEGGIGLCSRDKTVDSYAKLLEYAKNNYETKNLGSKYSKFVSRHSPLHLINIINKYV